MIFNALALVLCIVAANIEWQAGKTFWMVFYIVFACLNGLCLYFHGSTNAKSS